MGTYLEIQHQRIINASVLFSLIKHFLPLVKKKYEFKVIAHQKDIRCKLLQYFFSQNRINQTIFFSIMSTQAWGQTLQTPLATPKDQTSKQLPRNVLLSGAYLFSLCWKKTSWQSNSNDYERYYILHICFNFLGLLFDLFSFRVLWSSSLSLRTQRCIPYIIARN